MLLGVLGESLLLALVPVLVEATLDLVAQVLSPDGGERAETTGSLDVANKTDGDHLQIIRSLDCNSSDAVERTGGVSTTVTASTISFLCSLAPGRSRSRTMVLIPAL